MLVRFERDTTGDEASQFVAELAAKLVGFVDLDGILEDIRHDIERGHLDGDSLRNTLVGHFRAFAQCEDEEILDWVIDYLMKGGD